ncbi:hypothetical protein ACFY2Q_20655 [Micromonospora sp. NPDC000316]|uniref:hypothetical protein n=1 Tax=Micromonospora sp. NPDC000316 TaxID=3364216 RepID=UPI0036A8FBB7
MTDDILRSFQQLRSYALDLQGILTDAQASAPEQVVATDATGTVQVVLGADGSTESIAVATGWRRRLAAEQLTAAVLEACEAAAVERMAAVSEALPDAGADPGADRPFAEPGPVAPADPLPADMREQVDRAQPRPLDELVEDVLRAADNIDEYAALSPIAVTGTGTDASRQIVVTVSRAGLLSCEAEPYWLDTQGGADLTAALTEAVAAARADLADATRQAAGTSELDQLFVETLATLNELQRSAQSAKDQT